jgi:hypothetical protein
LHTSSNLRKKKKKMAEQLIWIFEHLEEEKIDWS